jgi:hypothetical protein
VILAILMLVGLVAGAFDEESIQSSTPTPSSPVAVGEVKVVTVASGDEATITVPVQVADGHRVQANPASNEFLVPLQLEIEEIDGFAFDEPIYPMGEPYLLEGDDEPLSTYVAEFKVVVRVAVEKDTAPGEYVVSGTLHFQACNSRMCLFPSSVPVELLLVVAAP